MTKSKAVLAGVAIVLMLGMIAACSTFSKDASRTLAVSQQTYEAALTTLGDLYKQGRLSEEQKVKAVELARVYKNTHNAAVSALEAYILAPKGTEEEKKQAYVIAASKASVALADFIAYLRDRKEAK